MKREPFRLCVLVSGRGSNLEAIIKAGEERKLKSAVVLVISDRGDAPALEKAKSKNISAFFIDPRCFNSKLEYEDELMRLFAEHKVDLIVLAGFMRLLSPHLLSRYKNRVVNIHPSLLPSFPGLKPQKKAIEYGVKLSGCTVHFVDEGMDTGPIILQKAVPVLDNDDEQSLADRILAQEHDSYWRAIELIAEGKIIVQGRKVLKKTE